MANASKPDWAWQISFTDPNDPAAVPVWRDLTGHVRTVGGNFARGEDYELAQGFAQSPVFMLKDTNQDLNPDNPASPYAGLINPYRPVIWRGMWPQPGTVWAAGLGNNLLNANMWTPNDLAAYDPSFESYALGSRPYWVKSIGSGVTPAVSSSNPHGGAKSMQYAVTAGGGTNGIGWTVPCIPGRVYTSSAFVRQSAANTTQIFIDGGAAGSVTAAVGAYALLSVTWMATQPTHDVWTASFGTSLTGVVNVDDIQHEPAPRLGVDDGSFKTGVGGWTATRGTLAPSTSIGPPPSHYSARLTTSGGAASSSFFRNTDMPPVVPANSYWLSVQVMSPAGFTGGTVAAIDWFDSGHNYLSTSTSSTFSLVAGQWTQISLLAQAPAGATLAMYGPSLFVPPDGTVVYSTVQGFWAATPSAFAVTGPVIYPILRGYAERFTPSYQDNGYTGYVTIPVVDALPALNAIKIGPEYDEAVQALAPLYYWKLDGGPDSTSFPDSSGHGGPPAMATASKQGAGGGFSPGASIDIPGAPSATGVQLYPEPGAADLNHMKTTGLNVGYWSGNGVYRNAFSFPPNYNPAVAYGLTVALWFQGVDTTPNFNMPLFSIYSLSTPVGSTTPNYLRPVEAYLAAGQVQAFSWGVNLQSASHGYADGKPHLLVITFSQDPAANTALALTVDGVTVSGSAATSVIGMLSQPATTFSIGGFVDYYFQFTFNGVISRPALWDRALTPDEVGRLWTASQGFAGETAGTRVTRHLAIGKYNGATRISPGSTTLGPPTWSGDIDLLTDSNNSADAELGAIWTAPDGAFVFEGRAQRFLRLTPEWLFGENLGSSETPYLGDVSTDRDPTYIYGDVQFTRTNGATALGGLSADINTVTRRTFPRTFRRSSDLDADAEAQYLADWIFYTHWAALTRLEAITIDPAANPALWPVALSVEVGQRIRWTRRVPGANGGAGLTVTLDFFISKVTPTGIDFDAGTFKVQLQCVPVGDATQPGSSQPWILEDPVYGQLGVTTRLAP